MRWVFASVSSKTHFGLASPNLKLVKFDGHGKK